MSSKTEPVERSPLDHPPHTNMWRHRYTVIGAKDFPVSMLARDESYPATIEDAGKILALMEGRTSRVVEIQLEHVGPLDWNPNLDRWYPLGWRIRGCPSVPPSK